MQDLYQKTKSSKILGSMPVTDFRYYGLDDLERLEEMEKRKKIAGLRDQLITALIVTLYGAFLIGFLWATSIKPALPL